MQPVPLQPDNNDNDDNDNDDNNNNNNNNNNDNDNDDNDDDDDDSDVGPNTAEWNSIQPPAPFVVVVVPCGADNLGAGGAPHGFWASTRCRCSGCENCAPAGAVLIVAGKEILLDVTP